MDTKKYSIYKITNPTGKVYIGQTCNPRKRFESYKRCKPDQKAIYNSLQKYGYEAHTFKVMFKDLTKVEVDIFEIELIEFYKSEGISLNIARGGTSNIIPTNLISIVRFTLEGEYIDEFESITEAARQLSTSPSTISCSLPTINGKKRKSHTSNGYLWLLRSDYEKGVLPQLKPKDKRLRSGYTVNQFDLTGNFINSFCSISEAARAINVNKKVVKQNLDGKSRRVLSFIFSTKDKVEPYKKYHKCRTVYLYDLEGNLINTFNNCQEAGRELGLHPHTVSRRVKIPVDEQRKQRLYHQIIITYESKIV